MKEKVGKVNMIFNLVFAYFLFICISKHNKAKPMSFVS